MCELPGFSSSQIFPERSLRQENHKKEICWQRKRDERENAEERWVYPS